MHKKEVRAINKMMNRAAHSALRDVNLVLFVVDAQKWTQNDELVLEKLKNAEMPVILVINKLDTFENKNEALPLIRERAKLMNFAEIVPVSALRGANLDHLRDTIEKYLPFQPPLYSWIKLPIVLSVFWPVRLSVKKSCVSWVKNCLMI
jgi:GTP-binding protein Era